MTLVLKQVRFYRVKKGQTLCSVARAFGVPPRVLAVLNRLEGEIEAGRVLEIPQKENVYTVRGGESKRMLCGSAEKFREKNGTDCLYPMQEIFL